MGNAESAPSKEEQEEGEACTAPPCTVPMLDFGELQAQLATNYKKDNMAWNMGGTFWAGADGNIHFVAHDSEAGSKFGDAAEKVRLDLVMRWTQAPRWGSAGRAALPVVTTLDSEDRPATREREHGSVGGTPGGAATPAPVKGSMRALYNDQWEGGCAEAQFERAKEQLQQDTGLKFLAAGTYNMVLMADPTHASVRQWLEPWMTYAGYGELYGPRLPVVVRVTTPERWTKSARESSWAETWLSMKVAATGYGPRVYGAQISSIGMLSIVEAADADLHEYLDSSSPLHDMREPGAWYEFLGKYLAKAVVGASSSGILMCDMKPPNVLVKWDHDDPNSCRVMMSDFDPYFTVMFPDPKHVECVTMLNLIMLVSSIDCYRGVKSLPDKYYRPLVHACVKEILKRNTLANASTLCAIASKLKPSGEEFEGKSLFNKAGNPLPVGRIAPLVVYMLAEYGGQHYSPSDRARYTCWEYDHDKPLLPQIMAKFARDLLEEYNP